MSCPFAHMHNAAPAAAQEEEEDLTKVIVSERAQGTKRCVCG